MKQMEFMHSNVFWPSPLVDVAPLVTTGELSAEEGAELFIEKVNALYAEAGE
jgi:multiple sugar transport system substrate-binding protein